MKNRNTVLVVDDDNAHRTMLYTLISGWGYEVTQADDGATAIEKVKEQSYDLVLMDVVLTGISGLDLAKTIRKTDYTTPILFMSTKDDDKEKIHAYCSGGDDYIVKPFTITELSLRIYALLRRAAPKLVSQEMPETLRFGDFTFDYPNRVLCTATDTVPLTKKEADVLRMLAINVNNVVKREKVLTDVWGENDYFMGRSMDVYIARLRKKLAEDKNVSIVNVHRMGFKLEVTNGIVG